MYAAAVAAQHIVSDIAFPKSDSPPDIRRHLTRVVPPPATELERHVLEGLIARAEREARRLTIPSSPRASETLSMRTERLLAERYAEPWTIARLANELATNHNTLTTDFKNTFGISVHNRLVQYRVRAAESHLASGEKLSTIAANVGFRSTKTLYDAFRRVTGVGLPARRAAGRSRRSSS